jgi:hypothetical protein
VNLELRAMYGIALQNAASEPCGVRWGGCSGVASLKGVDSGIPFESGGHSRVGRPFEGEP